MRLKSLQCIENEGTPQEWVLEEMSVGHRNLIVGKNASGKSRILNVIGGFANILSSRQRLGLSGNYLFQLLHDDKSYEYEIKRNKEQVISEKLSINGNPRLSRGEGGIGTIWAEQIEQGKEVKFQTPTSELAAVVRRDTIQHSFLEPLYAWASSVRHYHFGSTLGKNNVTFLQPGSPKVDERDENAVVEIFRDGIKKYPSEFISSIIRDLAIIDYHVEDVHINSPISMQIAGLPGEPLVLRVKEKDLPGITDQFSMSQGMFRVLSLLIQVNYLQLNKTATCVLVDDIGEGLDFDRSCRLIELLRSKADHSNLQIILSTNDRYVMNQVPLDEWSVLQRKGNHVKVRNYSNSREVFDEFKFTGLSNFSFLELDVINESPAVENPPLE
jgi:predicted ATP-dependent endonuclease of OLD family